jgi:tetratricopeptide (TPR) repeat protein
MFHLAEFYHIRSNNQDAALLYDHALAIWETTGQLETPEAITAQSTLGNLYRAEGKYTQAEPLLAQALETTELKLGQDQLKVASSLNSLALLYYCESNYDAAEPLYRRALEIRVQALGADDPVVLQTMQIYAAVLRQEGRKAEALKMEELADAMAIAKL